MGLLDGKVAVITGAGSGMAKASTKLFVAEGARVVAADVSGAEKDTAAEVGDAVLPVHCDVTQEADVAALFEAAVAEFGRVDAVLNVAGIGVGGSITKLPMSDYDLVMDVDVRGVLLGMKHGIPPMIDAGGGSIVNWSSVGGLNASGAPADDVGVQRGESGGDLGDQVGVGRVRAQERPGQRDLPRVHRDRDHGGRGRLAVPRDVREGVAQARRAARRGGAGRAVPVLGPGVVRLRRGDPGRRRLVGQVPLTVTAACAVRKNVRRSSTNSSGCSMAAKWPPRGMLGPVRHVVALLDPRAREAQDLLLRVARHAGGDARRARAAPAARRCAWSPSTGAPTT